MVDGTSSAPGDADRGEAWHEKMMLEHRTDYIEWQEASCRDDRLFLVLGMHRSGTSCLVACLEQSGVHIGEVERFSLHQPRGNLEQRRALDINDAFLERAGGSWRNLPNEPPSPTAQQSAAIDELLAALEAHAPSALKDPRLLVTFDAWFAAASTPALLGTFRHPAEVVRSLRERDGMAVEAAYDLWLRYNERLVSLHRRFGFPLIEFDLSDHDAYCAVVCAVAAEFGLVPRVSAIRAVVENAAPRSSGAPGPPVPAECAEVFEYLRDHRHSGRLTPGSFEAGLVEIGASYTEPVAVSGRQALVRGVWLANRSLPRPLKTAFRPVQRGALRILRHIPSRSGRGPG